VIEAVIAYAESHRNRWPDSLEQVLDGGYLEVPDREAFLARIQYFRPWVVIEDLPLVSSLRWDCAVCPDYESVLVVRDRDEEDRKLVPLWEYRWQIETPWNLTPY
jgi:hypothetical protein